MQRGEGGKGGRWRTPFIVSRIKKSPCVAAKIVLSDADFLTWCGTRMGPECGQRVRVSIPRQYTPHTHTPHTTTHHHTPPTHHPHTPHPHPHPPPVGPEYDQHVDGQPSGQGVQWVSKRCGQHGIRERAHPLPTRRNRRNRRNPPSAVPSPHRLSRPPG